LFLHAILWPSPCCPAPPIFRLSSGETKIVTEMLFAYVCSVYHSYALVPVPTSTWSCSWSPIPSPSPLPCPLDCPSVRSLSVVRWSVADIEPLLLSAGILGSEISFGRSRNQIETIFLMCAMCIINNLLDFMVHRWVAAANAVGAKCGKCVNHCHWLRLCNIPYTI